MKNHRFKVSRVPPKSMEYKNIEIQFSSTIVTHRGNRGGVFSSYNIVRIQKVEDQILLSQYEERKKQIALKNKGNPNERMLFHGTPSVYFIAGGCDVQLANASGMFGPGIYFTGHSSKANQYVFPVTGCRAHNNTSCYVCLRAMLVCRVTLGNSFHTKRSFKQLPNRFNSVYGEASPGGLRHPESVVYQEDQVFPEYVVVYRIKR